jgi:FolB domain-containing protein
MPVDRIVISDLRLRCVIGINPEERQVQQDIVLNLTLFADLGRAGQSDDIADTIDYKALKKRIMAKVEASCFGLLEKLATEVARLCLEPEAVQAVTVRLEKPGALRFARTVGVEIHREREDLQTRSPGTGGVPG